MFSKNFYRPVIIIGMHRSGTSMVAKLLHNAGINMGEERDHNEESLPFLNVNQEVMSSNGNDWLNPGSIVNTPASQSAMSMYVNHFKIDPNDYRFLGKPRPSLIRWFHDRRWGFKDPRNSFTLPIWMKLFPKAQVIHVVRDPRSVVRSLMHRNTIDGEVHDERLDDPLFCLGLWKIYVEACLNQCVHLPKKSVLQVRYEDVIHDPNTLTQLSKFVGRDLKHSYSVNIRSKSNTEEPHLDLSSVENLISHFGYVE